MDAAQNDSQAHDITREQDGDWLYATCSCGSKSHLTTRKAQVTAWINRHLAAAQA